MPHLPKSSYAKAPLLAANEYINWLGVIIMPFIIIRKFRGRLIVRRPLHYLFYILGTRVIIEACRVGWDTTTYVSIHWS